MVNIGIGEKQKASTSSCDCGELAEYAWPKFWHERALVDSIDQPGIHDVRRSCSSVRASALSDKYGVIAKLRCSLDCRRGDRVIAD